MTPAGLTAVKVGVVMEVPTRGEGYCSTEHFRMGEYYSFEEHEVVH